METFRRTGNPPNKLVGRERRILWRLSGMDTDRVLRDFARWCALQVVHRWDAPDVVRRWLESGDESLRVGVQQRICPDDPLLWPTLASDLHRAAKAALCSANDTEWLAAVDAAWYTMKIVSIERKAEFEAHLVRLVSEARFRGEQRGA